MSLHQRFEASAESIKNLTKRPTDHELLELYALFKQGSIGDVNTAVVPMNVARPGMFDLKGKAKWDAWSSKKGMSQNEAKEAYIKLVDELLQKYND